MADIKDFFLEWNSCYANEEPLPDFRPLHSEDEWDTIGFLNGLASASDSVRSAFNNYIGASRLHLVVQDINRALREQAVLSRYGLVSPAISAQIARNRLELNSILSNKLNNLGQDYNRAIRMERNRLANLAKRVSSNSPKPTQQSQFNVRTPDQLSPLLHWRNGKVTGAFLVVDLGFRGLDILRADDKVKESLAQAAGFTSNLAGGAAGANLGARMLAMRLFGRTVCSIALLGWTGPASPFICNVLIPAGAGYIGSRLFEDWTSAKTRDLLQ